MAPAIPPRSQMRRPAASVRAEGGRDFSDSQFQQGCLHDHLGGKLHASRPQFHPAERIQGEAPQAAIEVANWALKEYPSDGRQSRCANPPVLPWHGPRLDAALKPVPYDQVISLSQFLDEGQKAREIVAIVGIAHDDVLAACVRTAIKEGCSIAPDWDMDDPGTTSPGNILRTIAGAVIANDNFPLNPALFEKTLSLSNAGFERFPFVQARHQDCQLDLRRLSARSRSLVVHDYLVDAEDIAGA